jgi:hypothetical protein
MKTKILFAMFVFAIMLVANQASAYYCPSTGRWLSRDPNGELGFETLHAASAAPRVGQIASTATLPPGRWAQRDPIPVGEINLPEKLATLTPRQQFALWKHKPNPDEFAFVSNHPLNSIDPLGLTEWCGTCEAYGAGIDIGLEAIECYLTSPCKDCKQEFIHVKGIFAAATAGLPVNSTKFHSCFSTPDGSDYTAFNGWARFESITVVAGGAGKTGGTIVFGDAQSDEVSNASGFDWSIAFGSGRSWVHKHSIIQPCE